MPPFIVQPFSFFKGAAPVVIPTADFGMFYGGLTQPGGIFNNQVRRIDQDGNQIDVLTNVGTSRQRLAGGRASSNAVFKGGVGSTTHYTRVTVIGNLGNGISEFLSGDERTYSAGATTSGNVAFYGGTTSDGKAGLNTCERYGDSGNKIGSTTSLGTARSHMAGATLSSTAIFYGGTSDLFNETLYNRCTRINSSGAIVGSETNLGSGRMHPAGGKAGESTAVYYGAGIGQAADDTRRVTRVNSSGAQIGSEAVIGSRVTSYPDGAGTSSVMITHGVFGGPTQFNVVFRINSSGAQVGSYNNVGTGGESSGGASM